MNDNYGITLYSSPDGYSGYRVRVGRYTDDNEYYRSCFDQTFSFIKYEGKENALKEALKYRDKCISNFKIENFKRTNNCMVRFKIPFALYKQKNNKTGYRGVSITDFYTNTNDGITHRRQACGIIKKNNKEYKITRSCLKYGDERAIKICYEWRLTMEKTLA